MSSESAQKPHRAVTMADVARAAGVSRQLVSLAIRGTGYVSPHNRALVLETAERLGYRRNQLAASLAGHRTQTIGLSVLDMHNQVYADFTTGVAEVIEPAGYRLLLAVGSGERPRHENIESLIGLRVDGILIADHNTEGYELAELLSGTPCVTLGEPSHLPNVEFVNGNDRLGAKQATEHLIAQGHTRIAYLTGPTGHQNSERRIGYREAMFAASLVPFEVDGDATEATGEAQLRTLHAHKLLPTALFCYNDASAFGVLSAAYDLGIDVPGALAVVGYDNTRAASYPGLSLTTVDQHAKRIGARAAQLLLQRIESEEPEAPAVEDASLDPQLIVRRSSAAPPAREG